MTRSGGRIVAVVALVIGVVLGAVLLIGAAPAPDATPAAAPALTSSQSGSGDHRCHGPLQQDLDHASVLSAARVVSCEDAPMALIRSVVTFAPPVAGPHTAERVGGTTRTGPSLSSLQVLRI